MSILFISLTILLIAFNPFTTAAKPSFGLQDAIKGSFWVAKHELQQNDPILIGRNFIEFLGQKVFIESAALSGQSSLSLEDLTVNESMGDACGLLTLNRLTITINEVAIDAFIVNFGIRLTEITLENTNINWSFTYCNSTRQLTSLKVVPQFGTIMGRIAVDLGGHVFEKSFNDTTAVDAVNNMFSKNSDRLSMDLMKIINIALHFYNTPTNNILI